jgi:catechol 2,3-dioxygenase-like lactoylglutathione lyase family enzyme
VDGFGLQFHHLGLAVKKPATATAYLGALGYREGHRVFDPLQAVNLAMFHHDSMPDVEVIWPGDGPSPIDSILKKSDGRVYHICYTAPDPEAAVAAMQEQGFDVLEVAAPQPAVLFGGQKVSFYAVVGFGLIEIIDRRPHEATGAAV